MTADDSEENLSMEDILSSIKNILEENETSGQAASTDNAAADERDKEAPARQPAEDEEVENEAVFNLSPSMMIDNPEEGYLSPEVQSPQPDEKAVVEAPDSELSISENEEPEKETLTAAETGKDIIDAEVEPASETTEDASVLLNLDDVPADASSDPIYAPEDDMARADAADVSVVKTADTPVIEDQFINQNIEQTDSGVEDSLIDDETINEVISRAPLQDDERDPTGNMTEIAAVEEAEKADSPAVLKDDAVDVSADIINNFAKIFSEHKGASDEAAQPYAAPSPDMPVGNSAATLEELLKSVIRDIIADEIKRQLQNSNLAVSDIALEEIKTQTNGWLNENLPAIVESVVQKEIERVMVKVGGN